MNKCINRPTRRREIACKAASEEFMEHYHKRSNIETAYSMIKGKFGCALRSKRDTGQINEALCKVLCHNVCVLVQAMHELGIEPVFSSSS